MKILITGTAGFIGFHLARALAKNTDYQIVGIDNINSYYDIRLKLDRLEELGINSSELIDNQMSTSSKYSNFEFYKTDLKDINYLQQIFTRFKPTIVCHLAAQAGVRFSISHPEEYISNNINAFFNMIKLSNEAKVEHLIYASSSSIYGLNSEHPYIENQRTENPVSLYAATKKSNELIAHVYSHIYGLKTTGLRFFTAYGAWGRPDMAPILFAKAISENKTIKVFNNGKLQRDFTYIEDIINGIKSIIDHNVVNRMDNYKIYNIGRGKPENLMDFIAEIEKNLNKIADKEFLPMQDGDVEKTFADISELKKDLDYYPQIDIKQGIPLFIKWFKKYYDYN